MLSALLLTGYSNGINQIADIETDRINRPDRPLPAGTISAGAAWTATIALCAAAIGVGALVNAAFLGCVLVTVPVTTIYSLPPRLKRYRFLANAAIATPRGMGVVLAGWASGNGFFRVDAWVLSAVAWIYIFGASVTKDFADVEGDRATGCSTLPILWGAAAAARFVAPFLGFAFAADGPAIRHPFACSDYSKGPVFLVSADGKVEWEFATANCNDLWVLANGNLLFNTGHGVGDFLFIRRS